MDGLPEIIRGKKIAVIGAGRSGEAAAFLLGERGASVFVSDQKPGSDALIQQFRDKGIECEFGGHTDRIYESDAWIISPGLSYHDEKYLKAKEKGISIYAELEAASWFCKAPIVAVTGSNGKSTTTAWIGDMCRKAGKQTAVAGNIGHAFSLEVGQLPADGIAVLEVSNFQLESIETFHPQVALLLNLTPDHLDRHGSMAEYARIKARIFENQTASDVLIDNIEDPLVCEKASAAKSRLWGFGLSPHKGDGASIQDGMITVVIDQHKEYEFPASDIALPGKHNLQNAMGAMLAARALDLPREAVAESLRTFKALAHRLEFVRELGGVRYYNDSKATNVDSVQYALQSFQNPVILIAGGRDKNSDFTLLNSLIRKHVKKGILIGEAAEKMAQAWDGLCDLESASTLETAIRKAKSIAQKNDVVLLSPACASFDMFKNFEDRGDQFKQLVMQL